MLNSSFGQAGSSQAESVRSQSPTETLAPVAEPTVPPHVGDEPSPTSVPAVQTAPVLAPTLTVAPMADPQEAEAVSVHAELYEAVNTIRASVSEFPLEVDFGLEAAAQRSVESGAGNTGVTSVADLLFDQGVRCRDVKVDSAPSSYRPEEGWPGQQVAVAESHLPGFAKWAEVHEDYATHLIWWMEWPSWDIIFLGSNWTHFGYGAAEAPQIGHHGVIFLCEQ
jgi:hypothetical protein